MQWCDACGSGGGYHSRTCTSDRDCDCRMADCRECMKRPGARRPFQEFPFIRYVEDVNLNIVP